MKNTFPFPICAASVNNAFGKDMGQVLNQEWDDYKFYQPKNTRRLLEYVLNPAHQVTVGLLSKQMEFCERVKQAMDKKCALIQIVEAYLASLETQYEERLRMQAMAATHLKTSDDIMQDDCQSDRLIYVCRDGGKNRYIVSGKLTMFCWRLFADGVMLPYTGSHQERREKYTERVGVMDCTHPDSLHFDSDALAQEFRQSATTDDYFAEIGATGDLDKLACFFGSIYRHGEHFETQATIDKFYALFPEVVARIKQFENKSEVDLIKFIGEFRENIAPSWHQRQCQRQRQRIFISSTKEEKELLDKKKLLNDYTFRFALWYLLCNGRNIYQNRSYEDLLALRKQTQCLLSILHWEDSKWKTIQEFLRVARAALNKHRELAQAGFVINQTVFVNHRNVPYLFTGFNVEAYGENMEFTRILKDNKLSQSVRGKEYANLADIKQGRYLRPAPQKETVSATC